MRWLRSCFLVPTLALIALVFLFPALTTALPQGPAIPLAAERQEVTPGLFSQLWSFLSALWSENGSGLEPNGGANPDALSEPEPNDADSGDNGSILDPNG